MIARTSRVCLEVLAASFLGLVLLGAAAAWRLSQGPVSLTFLTSAIEEALNDQAVGYRVRIGSTKLTWAGWERTLDIRGVDVALVARDGQVVASVPEMSISLSARGLLKGLVTPTRLELIEPRLRLVRTAAGDLELAFGDSGAISGELARQLARGFQSPSDKTPALQYLRLVSVDDARLTVDDRASGTVWESPRADVVLWRDEKDLRADIDVDIDLGGARPARLRGDVLFKTVENRLRANLRVADVPADRLVRRLPVPGESAMLAMVLGGRLTLEVGDVGGDGQTLAVDFEIAGADGRLAPSASWPAGLAIKALSARGRVQRNPEFAVFDEFAVDLGGPKIAGNAVITRIGSGAAINGQATVRDTPIDALARYWPPGLAKGARDWVTGNMKGGVIDEIRVDASMRAGPRGLGAAHVDGLKGTLAFRDSTVRYLDGFPSVEKVAGTAVFDHSRFTVTFKNGQQGDIHADGGRLDLDRLDTDNEHAKIDLVLRGPLNSALGLIDRPPFRFASKVGIDSRKTTGDVAARLVFDFPLTTRLTLDQVSIAAAANMRNVATPGFLEGLGLRDGTLTLRVDRTGLDVKGKARLGPAPVAVQWFEDFADRAKVRRRYQIKGMLGEAERKALGLDGAPWVKGPVDVELALLEHAGGAGEATVKLGLKPTALEIAPLGWSKPAGREGIAWLTLRLDKGHVARTMDFDVRTTGLRSRGRYVFAEDKRPLRLELRQFTTASTDISGTITGRSEDGFELTLAGKALNAAPLIEFAEENEPAATLPPLRIRARIDRLWIDEGKLFTNVDSSLIYDGRDWRTIDLAARLDEKHEVVLGIHRQGPARTLSFNASNAGAALKSLGILDTVRDGTLTLSGERDASKPGAPWQGHLRVSNFRVVKAPLLTRVLSLGSLTGIVDALKGKGITFARFDMPYTYKDKLLTVSKARAVGPALGLTGSGTLDVGTQRLDIKGTVVPAYTINNVLGNIPVLGTILTGTENSGVFAMTYGVEGPVDKPEVKVNPLSALAPGVLRDLIDGLTSGAGQAPKGPLSTHSDE